MCSSGFRTFRKTAIFVGALLSGFATMAGPPPATLQNKRLLVGLDAGNGRLVQFTDRNAKWNHVADPATLIDLWSLEVVCNGKHLTVTPALAKRFEFEQVPEANARRLTWQGFGNEVAPELKVIVEVRLPADGAVSRWNISVEHKRGLILEKVHFPRFPSIRPQSDECLAVPVWMGQLTANPRKMLKASTGKEARMEWESPGHTSMQCLAFYQNGGPGLYFSCDDTASFRKSFAVWGDGSGAIHYEMTHLPESRDADSYTLPYAALIGAFQGDWFTAAQQYRSWATNQPWARESRLASGVTPAWALDTGMWVWNRGRSPGVIDPAIALERELNLPVRVFWHWWHGCAYDTGFPEYLPPREGEESFTNALARAHQANVRAIVYMNQRLWGMTTESWKREGAEKYAVKGADGTIRPEVYNTFTRQPCASMCMGTAFWRNKYASLAEEAVEKLGVDGIYMDQACSSLACYDPAHGHPLGGGRYWMQGFRELADDIRSRCGGKREIVLAGEGCGEGWLPYLDLMLSLQVSRERYASPDDGWEPIPFFQAVYHPYCVLYGNYSSLTMPPYDDLWPAEFAPTEPLKLLDRKYSQQFLLEQARAFVWGQQPTVANFMPAQLRERPEETEFMMQLARLRHRALKYMLNGTFLRPPTLDVPSARMPMSRLSIYAGQQGALRSFEGQYPLAMAGAWRAPNGTVGVAVASIADSPLKVHLSMNAEEYGLPRKGTAYRISPSGRLPIAKFKGRQVTVEVPLAPRGACVVEFGR